MHNRNGTVDLRCIPKIVRRPLGQFQADGMAEQYLHSGVGQIEPAPEPVIYLDTKIKGRAFLETIIHEARRMACPWMHETDVRKLARYIAMIVWFLGFRAQTNQNEET